MIVSHDLRTSLKRIAEMMPLSERESELARMALKLAGCSYDHMEVVAKWLGEDKVEAFAELFAAKN